jgi:hypothetical protein
MPSGSQYRPKFTSVLGYIFCFNPKRRNFAKETMIRKKSLRKKLSVKVEGGEWSRTGHAADVFADALTKIGLERVAGLDRRLNGLPLISRKKYTGARALRERQGYFIETHSSTDTKAGLLAQIATMLGIEVAVLVVDDPPLKLDL